MHAAALAPRPRPSPRARRALLWVPLRPDPAAASRSSGSSLSGAAGLCALSSQGGLLALPGDSAAQGAASPQLLQSPGGAGPKESGLGQRSGWYPVVGYGEFWLQISCRGLRWLVDSRRSLGDRCRLRCSLRPVNRVVYGDVYVLTDALTSTLLRSFFVEYCPVCGPLPCYRRIRWLCPARPTVDRFPLSGRLVSSRLPWKREFTTQERPGTPRITRRCSCACVVRLLFVIIIVFSRTLC